MRYKGHTEELVRINDPMDIRQYLPHPLNLRGDKETSLAPRVVRLLYDGDMEGLERFLEGKMLYIRRGTRTHPQDIRLSAFRFDLTGDMIYHLIARQVRDDPLERRRSTYPASLYVISRENFFFSLEVMRNIIPVIKGRGYDMGGIDWFCYGRYYPSTGAILITSFQEEMKGIYLLFPDFPPLMVDPRPYPFDEDIDEVLQERGIDPNREDLAEMLLLEGV